MFPIRVKTVQESDLRMLGSLARNIQRVLPVTQADIDAAAALGKGWVVWKVFEVSDPLDNLRGGTQLIIRQNSIQPGQNVRRVIFVSGPGGQTVVIRGTDYIVLPDAIANSLSYVKAFGGTEQQNIPQPYTQVNYVTNTAQTAVDTGIMIDFAKNYEFEVECRATTGSWYILQSRASSTGNITGIHGATSGSTITLVVGNVTVCTSAITRTVGNKLYVKATLNAGTATLYVKDETANTEDTQTGSYGTSQPNPTAAVYLLGNAGGQYVDVNSDIYMARIKENGVTVMDYVPARQAATAGFYDNASGTFKTALTPANLSADGNTVPTPDAPMDIVCNNGVLVIQGSATGTVTQTGNPTPTTPVDPVFYQNHGLLLRAIGTDADTYNESTQTITRNIGYKIFDGTESFGASSAYGKALLITSASSAWGANKSKDVLCQYFLGTSDPTGGMPEFTCFFNASGHFYLRTPETATDFKAWLAELYTNGTPLIVWFVKSSTATESFTPSVYADGTVETIKLLYNHWDMTKATYSAPGFNVSSASVAQDGTFSITNSSGSSASRIQLTLSASDLGLINGQKYTIKVFILDGNAFNRSCSIYHGSSPRTYSCDGTQTTLVDSWTQSDDDDVKVGFVYFKDYAVGTIVRLRVMVIAGETEPDTYQPYIENSATAEMLLKVGNYQDEQQILSGVVTRNVGVKVLDGTEDGWTKTNNSFGNSSLFEDKKIEKSPLVCSHFQYNAGTTTTIPNGCIGTASGTANIYFRNNALSTVGDWKQWLADQCAAGTPVIVVYPLAEPTTETVTGQTLQVTDGDNVLEITQASLTGLELEAQYNAAVSLTIQEVQDANLDNNVIVTIQ